MLTRALRTWLVVFVVLAAADLTAQRGGGGRGRGQGPPPTFRANADLVQIDVIVLDADGKAVRGLTKDDFRLIDRKQPQPIAVFDEVVHTYDVAGDAALPADVPRDVSSNTTPRAERLVVLAIDDMVPADRFDRIKDLARQVVNDLGHEASMALLTSSEARKVEVTENRALLLAEIDRISERSAAAPRVARMKSVETGSCSPRMFEQAARMLSGDDGRRKAFVYISPYCAGDLKDVVKAMLEQPGDTGAQADLIRMIEAMRRANVALYTIDPRGAADFSLGHFDAPDLVSKPGSGAGRAAAAACMTRSCDPVLQSQDNMRAVTGMTGGFAITNTNDYRAGMTQLVDDFDHYYLLGFYPADRTSKAFRPVEVTVDRPGLTLRYRRGYQIGGAPDAPKNKDPMVQLSAGVMPRNDLPLRLFLMPLPSAAKLQRVAVAVEISPRNAVTSPGFDSLDLTMLAVDLKKTKVSREFKRARQVILSPGQGGQPASIEHYQVVTTVDLPPGLYQLRASASSGRLGLSGSVYGTVELPNYADTPLAIGGLLVGYGDAKRRGRGPTVMDANSLPFEPALERVFSAADELRLYCDLWRKDAAKVLTTKVELLDARGQVLTTMDGTAPAGRLADPLPHLDVTFPLASLTPGAYRLRVSASDQTVSAAREIGLVVR
jgi:VWFA-related protein